MKKTMVKAILCGALFLLVLSTAFAGGKKDKKKDNVVAYDSSTLTWDWGVGDDSSNGGTSTINMEEISKDGMKAYKFTGSITDDYQYGFVNVQIRPAGDAVDILKTCTAFSFKVRGDENYAVKITTTDVIDYCYFETVFETIEGQDKLVIIPIGYLVQPTWGTQKARFSQEDADFIEFQTTRSNGSPGPFEFELWDLKLYTGGIPTEDTKAKKAAAPAASAKTVGGDLGAMTLKVNDNFQYDEGYQCVFSDKRMMNGHKIVPGEKFVLKITFTTSRDMEEEIQVGLVDTTPQASYWKSLSWDDNIEGTGMFSIPACKAGEVISETITFETVNSATGSSGAANALVFITKGEGKKFVQNSGVKKAFTLDVTEFVFSQE